MADSNEQARLPLAGIRVLEVSLLYLTGPRGFTQLISAFVVSSPVSHQDLSLAVRRELYYACPTARLTPLLFAVVLADFGADVVRVDRYGSSFSPDALCRRVKYTEHT